MHDDNEAYKAHKETFLRGGLQRYVCHYIKDLAAFQTEGFFVAVFYNLKPSLREKLED